MYRPVNSARKFAILQQAAIEELKKLGFGTPNNVKRARILQPAVKLGKRRRKKIENIVKVVKKARRV